MLSEVALGQSDPGLSGTVIGMSGAGPLVIDSDIRLAESDIQLGEESKTPIPRKRDESKAPIPRKGHKRLEVRGVGLDPRRRADPGRQRRCDRRQDRPPAAVPPSISAARNGTTIWCSAAAAARAAT